MKTCILAGLVLAISLPLYGQGQKVSDRAALSSGSLAPATDILPIVDISAGASGSKKITINDLFTGWGFTTQGANMAKASTAAAQRTLLELGTAATLDHGTGVGNLVRLDPSTGILPAVDGSLLINLPATGPAGPDGKSAYQVALDDGFVGTEAAWIDSLVGATGPGVPVGGTAGQVLAKTSGTDYATGWTAPGTVLTDSASLRTALSDETGTGVSVFATSPSITTPTITTPTFTLGSDATGDVFYRGAGGGLTRLGIGTNGHVLTLTAGVPSWAAAPGAGGALSNWTEGVNTSSPNATVPVVSFTATNGATNVDAALVPKGTGAKLGDAPDGTSAGGAKRGNYAVDWQTDRASSTQVASGLSAVISGGSDNTASFAHTVVAGGTGHLATGNYASVGGGQENTASATAATIGGGIYNVASGSFSTIPGGYYGTTRGLYGVTASAAGRFSATGDAQSATYKMYEDTVNSTPVEAALGKQSLGSTSRIVLPNNHSYGFKLHAVAKMSDETTKTWRMEGAIKRGATAGTTALVGSVTEAVTEDAAASAWDLNLSADTTNGSLKVEVVGDGGGTTRFYVHIETVELGL